MPRACDPKQRLPYVLKSDRDKPKDAWPTFYFRALNGPEWTAVAEKYDELDKVKFGPELLRRLYDCVRMGLIDWERMPDRDGKVVPYDPEQLPWIVGHAEAHELVSALLNETRITPEEKKTSESAC